MKANSQKQRCLALRSKTQKQSQFLRECGFVQNIEPPPLSRDRRMKMKKSNQTTRHGTSYKKKSYIIIFRKTIFSLTFYYRKLLCHFMSS